jgi:glycosyltransferase involved in cell wall biosynthesis
MISVIIPAHDAGKTLPDCLDALARQTIGPSDYEVIVSDDGSTDDTAQIAVARGARVVVGPRRGPAAARNRGLAVARGKIVLFTDADCVPRPDWIDQMVAPIRAGADGVKGGYLNRQPGLVPRFVQVEFEEKYARLASQGTVEFVDTYAAAYRREILDRYGGFDAQLPGAEDVDLSFRVARQGCRFVFAPAARVYHHHSETLARYLHRKFSYAVHRANVYWRYPERAIGDSNTPRDMIVQIGLAGLVVVSSVYVVVNPSGWPAVVGSAGAFAASCVPFCRRAGRDDWRLAAVSPGILFLRSLAQCAGLAAGLGLGACAWLRGRLSARPRAADC